MRFINFVFNRTSGFHILPMFFIILIFCLLLALTISLCVESEEYFLTLLARYFDLHVYVSFFMYFCTPLCFIVSLYLLSAWYLADAFFNWFCLRELSLYLFWLLACVLLRYDATFWYLSLLASFMENLKSSSSLYLWYAFFNFWSLNCTFSLYFFLYNSFLLLKSVPSSFVKTLSLHLFSLFTDFSFSKLFLSVFSNRSVMSMTHHNDCHSCDSNIFPHLLVWYTHIHSALNTLSIDH